jgi:hypothetical protein
MASPVENIIIHNLAEFTNFSRSAKKKGIFEILITKVVV